MALVLPRPKEISLQICSIYCALLFIELTQSWRRIMIFWKRSFGNKICLYGVQAVFWKAPLHLCQTNEHWNHFIYLSIHQIFFNYNTVTELPGYYICWDTEIFSETLVGIGLVGGGGSISNHWCSLQKFLSLKMLGEFIWDFFRPLVLSHLPPLSTTKTTVTSPVITIILSSWCWLICLLECPLSNLLSNMWTPLPNILIWWVGLS